MKRFILFVVTIQFLNLLTAMNQNATDLEIIEQDFGPKGRVDTVRMNLTYGFQAGSSVVIISETNDQGTINIIDKDKNNLLQIDTRLYDGIVVLNSREKTKWHDRIVVPAITQKGAQTVTTIVYEEEGFSIFVDGKDFTFFKHRLHTPATQVVAFRNKIYKMVYVAVKDGNEIDTKNCPVLQI